MCLATVLCVRVFVFPCMSTKLYKMIFEKENSSLILSVCENVHNKMYLLESQC